MVIFGVNSLTGRERVKQIPKNDTEYINVHLTFSSQNSLESFQENVLTKLKEKFPSAIFNFHLIYVKSKCELQEALITNDTTVVVCSSAEPVFKASTRYLFSSKNTTDREKTFAPILFCI